ncbi:hypothetical protein I315_05007 [Cryptococcus gattii Ru294]|nr:hypothetical protein I315_05007 [Cryptococcus gattii Ru294]
MLWGIGKGRDHGHNVAVALLIYPLSLARRHMRCAMYNAHQGMSDNMLQ